MKTINIYFQATTKVSMAHLNVEDNENIEDYIKSWIAESYCKAHYSSEKIYIYIPWSNVLWVQYKDGHNIHGE